MMKTLEKEVVCSRIKFLLPAEPMKQSQEVEAIPRWWGET
jgi:hypothetical protein